MGTNWLDIGGTAVHFGVSEKTVRRWIKERAKLGFDAEMRRGAWTVAIDTITHAVPAGATPEHSAVIAELERQLAAEKRRADSALIELGRVGGRLEETAKLLTYHSEQEEQLKHQVAEEQQRRDDERRRHDEEKAALAAELDRLKRRGWVARLFNIDLEPPPADKLQDA